MLTPVSGPGFTALAKDPSLAQHHITSEFGYTKNPNKNPVAENAIKELGVECLKLCPEGGPLFCVTLAMITANLNSRLRKGGLSAREIRTQRDQVTGEQLPLSDPEVIAYHHNPGLTPAAVY